jgi:hypothetical protein
MRQDDRAPFQRARVSACTPGEFVEQETFMSAGGYGPHAAQRDQHLSGNRGTQRAGLRESRLRLSVRVRVGRARARGAGRALRAARRARW